MHHPMTPREDASVKGTVPYLCVSPLDEEMGLKGNLKKKKKGFFDGFLDGL